MMRERERGRKRREPQFDTQNDRNQTKCQKSYKWLPDAMEEIWEQKGSLCDISVL